jgi:hypothetical protein
VSSRDCFHRLMDTSLPDLRLGAHISHGSGVIVCDAMLSSERVYAKVCPARCDGGVRVLSLDGCDACLFAPPHPRRPWRGWSTTCASEW